MQFPGFDSTLNPIISSFPLGIPSNLRLYDVDSCLLRLEAPAPKLLFPTVAPRVSPLLLWLCPMVTLQGLFLFLLELKNRASAASNGSITRYDLYSGTIYAIGNHQDMASCVGYSIETCHVISAGLDKKVMSWDTRLANPVALFRNLGAEIDSISISGFDLIAVVGAAVSKYDLCGTMKERWI